MHYRGHGKRKEKVAENVFEEIIDENFLNPEKETDFLVQEKQRVSNKMNPKRSTPCHIIIKMAKIKDKERIKSLPQETRKISNKQSNVTPKGARKKRTNKTQN